MGCNVQIGRDIDDGWLGGCRKVVKCQEMIFPQTNLKHEITLCPFNFQDSDEDFGQFWVLNPPKFGRRYVGGGLAGERD